jgi:hypothetical protein
MQRTSVALALLIFFGCPPAQAQQPSPPPIIIGPNASTAPYTLSLSDDWREESSDDPEQRSFVRGDVHLVISSMAIEVPLEETERLAQFVAMRRAGLEAEYAGSRALTLTITEPVITALPYGQSMVFSGGDSSGRRFHFAGYVTRRQVLSTYVETPSLSEAELAAVLTEVHARLRVRRG